MSLSISSDDMKAKILAATGPNGQQIIRRVVLAGQQILFSAPTHQQAFDSIKDSPGKGIAHLMLVLYDKSRTGQTQPTPPAPSEPQTTGLINANAVPATPQPDTTAQTAEPSSATMPRGSLIPAGAILLASVAEFATKAGIKPIDDAAFNQELEELAVILMDRFDPAFRQKVASKVGEQQVPRGTNPEIPHGGLINNAGGA